LAAILTIAPLALVGRGGWGVRIIELTREGTAAPPVQLDFTMRIAMRIAWTFVLK